ncbi:F-box/kelch-repeat protein At3g27150 [Aristolochia californica]|uniref:F-box/kelch-repeat protein At3g27150 n=1 Tax=Aristolochia californica TaxID=171875 RepID=UPI0035E2D5B0
MRDDQVMLEKLLKMSVLDGDRRPQDADYSYIPSLNDELALLILARVPRSEYAKLSAVNKRYLDLLRSQYLYEIRREIGIGEPLVFMLADGEPIWRALDPRQGSCRQLPVLPSDPCFMSGDKESFCAGADLLVSGREIDGLVIWRYELDADTWFKGPPMISPRCLFASASSGSVAYVAGGFGVGHVRGILDTAERYDSKNKSWNPLPKMKKARKLCSGCFMDNKFYALGGKGEDGALVCGEFYDVEKRTWELIPDMMKDTSSTSSPPLIAVVNNELYSLDAASNKVKIYLKKTNSWKDMGEVPVRADRSKGWGVAFKSLGSELLVIGGASTSVLGHGILTICMCQPDPDGSSLNWRFLESKHNHLSSFVFNCSVMVT